MLRCKSGARGVLRSLSVSNLNSSLCEFRPLRYLLARVDVRIVRALEGPLQLLQLLRGEGGSTPPLLPLQRQTRLRVYIGCVVRVTG